MRVRKYFFAVIYGVILTAFTVYAVLDTFVIARVYETPVQPVTDKETAAKTTATETGVDGVTTGSESLTEGETTAKETTEKATETEFTPVVTDDTYDDGNIKITVTEYEYNDTAVYVADVVIASPDYFKTALAHGVYGKNVTAKTSEQARDAGAILAINGDYYGARESGYVIRNGILYRNKAKSKTDLFVVYDNGGTEIVSSSDFTAEELLEKGAEDVFCFGPGLLSGGQITVDDGFEVSVAMASNPRTAIGMIDVLHYVFIVSDGRTAESRGLSLYELACFMQDLGCETAYNLDGGGSSTMVFNGRIINNPTTNGRRITERSVSDIVYIGY